MIRILAFITFYFFFFFLLHHKCYTEFKQDQDNNRPLFRKTASKEILEFQYIKYLLRNYTSLYKRKVSKCLQNFDPLTLPTSSFISETTTFFFLQLKLLSITLVLLIVSISSINIYIDKQIPQLNRKRNINFLS